MVCGLCVLLQFRFPVNKSAFVTRAFWRGLLESHIQNGNISSEWNAHFSMHECFIDFSSCLWIIVYAFALGVSVMQFVMISLGSSGEGYEWAVAQYKSLPFVVKWYDTLGANERPSFSSRCDVCCTNGTLLAIYKDKLDDDKHRLFTLLGNAVHETEATSSDCITTNEREGKVRQCAS